MCEGERDMSEKMTEKNEERESGLVRARERGRGTCC